MKSINVSKNYNDKNSDGYFMVEPWAKLVVNWLNISVACDINT